MKKTYWIFWIFTCFLNSIQAQSSITFSPEFPGGQAALDSFIQKNVHIPPQALEERVQGLVPHPVNKLLIGCSIFPSFALFVG